MGKFYNQDYQLTDYCRPKTTGQFLYDYQCGGQAMVDNTWPGWSAGASGADVDEGLSGVATAGRDRKPVS